MLKIAYFYLLKGWERLLTAELGKVWLGKFRLLLYPNINYCNKEARPQFR